MRKTWLLAAMALVLSLAWGAAAYELWHGEKSRALVPDLKQRFPARFTGVKVADVPLGPNELADATAQNIMEYDDLLNRTYSTTRGTFQVYIGFWARGKRSPQHIASHTPDRCWILAGMTCLARREDYQVAGNSVRLPIAYWRRFRQPGGAEIETAFWHRVGDRLYDYEGSLNNTPSPSKRVLGVLHDLFLWREDQFFIRISSELSLQDFATEPVYLEVLHQIQLIMERAGDLDS